MPWRTNHSPYWVFVSEIMLQQTQVERVIPKFEAFIGKLHNWEKLAQVDTSTLLQLWSGLGYNNRAIRLRAAAQTIITQYGGVVPDDIEALDSLPGVGYATACAVLTYSYNIPNVFIETNIRRVFIHHFFPDINKISDTELEPIIAESLDQRNPREWYWALMDYGSYLKKIVSNPNHRSKHYTIQKKFEGSVRQMRGEILRRLTMHASLEDIEHEERFNTAIDGLIKDGIISHHNNTYKLI